MAVDFAVAVARVIVVEHVFATLAVRLADGKFDRTVSIQRTRENLRIACAVLREARQTCAGEVNCAVHRNGRGL